MDFGFDALFFAVFAAVIGFFAYRMVRHGGLKAAMFGARIDRTVGEVNGEKQGPVGVTLKVHVLRRDAEERLVGVEFVAKSFATTSDHDSTQQAVPQGLQRDMLNLLFKPFLHPEPNLNRLTLTMLFATFAPALFAEDIGFEDIISQTTYANYMAEKLCLTQKAESRLTGEIFSREWIEQTQSLNAEISKKVDPKYGLDKLSESEKNRMTLHFKRQGGTNRLVMERLRQINPTCE